MSPVGGPWRVHPYGSGRNSRRLALGEQFADFGLTSVLTGVKTDTVELPCATTSHKRPPSQNTNIFLVKARISDHFSF